MFFFSSDLYLKGLFVSVILFKVRKYQIILVFSQVLLYSYNVSKVNFICTLISMSSNPLMENPIDLIAFVFLAIVLKLSPPFSTCNGQLHHLPLFYFSTISLQSNK